MKPALGVNLDTRAAELAARDRSLAAEILKEAVRIPSDYVDRTVKEGGDPSCGLSNHEQPRLEYLKRRIVEIGAVRRPEDVGFDTFGNRCGRSRIRTTGSPLRTSALSTSTATRTP